MISTNQDCTAGRTRGRYGFQRARGLAGIAAICLAASLQAAAAEERRPDVTIEAGPNHIASVPRPDKSRNEVWVAASRKDPDTFVAVFHASSGALKVDGCESMVSKDGGQTWRRFNLEKENDCFDPMVVSGANGQFYVSYSVWSAPNPELGNWRGVSAPIRIYTSLDDGNTWSAPLDLVTPLRPDHQRQAVDLTGGRFNGRVYVAWVEFPARTVPGKFHTFLHYLDAEGRTQSKPILVHVSEEDRPVSLEPVVLSDGTLLLPIWYQHMGVPVDPVGEHRPVFLVRSNDGGETFGPPQKIVEVGMPAWRTRMHRFGGQATAPIFMADTSKSSRYRDRIYAVWNDARTGTTTDIWLIWSADKGRTWSAPVKVNDFAAPESDTAAPDVRLTPVVAVNKDGIVGVAWYDRREDPTHRCWKQYFAASLDGGRTFSRNASISTVPSCPPPNKPPIVEVYNENPEQKLPSWDELRQDMRKLDVGYGGSSAANDLLDVAKARVRDEAGLTAKSRITVSFDSGRNEFQGHYTGLAAAADGSFMAVWADARRGNQEMYSARIRVSSAKPAIPQLESRKLNDVVDVLADEVRFDEAAGITVMQVKIRNRSDRPIYPPLTLQVRSIAAGGEDVINNADNKNAGVGAEWDFSNLLGTQGRLDPGMISEPRAVELHSSVERGLDITFDYDVVGKAPAGKGRRN